MCVKSIHRGPRAHTLRDRHGAFPSGATWPMATSPRLVYAIKCAAQCKSSSPQNLRTQALKAGIELS
ncbi:hypothetical protein KEM48_011444 [Puccinia striiformis f. sp. tritici PST-130]|nr:hypothetical protein KEM48_011444 [Puccinia striiformis f. sp. tritici PST-130]